MKWLQGFFKRGKYVVPSNTPSFAIFPSLAYWICLFVGLFGIIKFMCGYKKGGRLTMLSAVIYWIIAAICSM